MGTLEALFSSVGWVSSTNPAPWATALTYSQAAARMGISVKVVEKHISRALLVCRDAVGEGAGQ